MLIFAPPAMQAQEEVRGVRRANTALAEVEEGKNYLLAIGVDQYSKWLKLGNAVSDAKGIVDLFTQSFGFETPVEPLYDAKATRLNITKSLEQVRRMLEPEDNLVVFFAGHGVTLTDTVGDQIIESGYIVPVDGAGLETDERDTYFKIDHLLNRLSLFPARHVNIILDACHSGLALGSEASSYRAEVLYERELESKLSRRVLTSARAEQLASDVGPLKDHSLFTGMLIDGLQTGRADIDKNGLITTSELGLYLEQSVSDYSEGRQIPDFGSFGLDERGEMTFELNNNSPSFLLTNAYNQLRNGQVNTFLETYRKIEKLDLPIDKTAYLTYRYAILTRKIDLALSVMEQRLQDSRSGISPLSEEEEEGFAERIPSLKHWSDILESPNLDPDSIQVELLGKDTLAIVPVHEDSLAVECKLPNESLYFFRITNKSSRPVYPYALFVDESGDIFPILLLPHHKNYPQNERIYRKGIAPGESTFTAPLFHKFGKGWFVDLKLFFTHKPYDYLVLSTVYVHHETFKEEMDRPEDMVSRTFRLIFR
jgi:hypothetical protein